MAQYVVIGTAPTVDTAVAVGPFRSEKTTSEAYDELTAKGYNAEVCELFAVADIDHVTDWGN